MQKPGLRPGMWFKCPAFILIVALQWSFTPTAVNTATYTYVNTDTSTSPVESRNYTIRSFVSEKMAVYDSLHLEDAGLSKKVFEMAVRGFYKLVKTGRVRENIISIADFSQPSINKRLYVIDLDNYEILFNTWVAHGVRSGKAEAQYFSNKISSHQSSLGFYITGRTYHGSNGYSLKLQGVEKGINDYAMRRGIVIHGADYVNEDFIESQGYIGRSYGCPAVAPEVSRPLIDQVKEGTCLFIYHPSTYYASRSRMIK